MLQKTIHLRPLLDGPVLKLMLYCRCRSFHWCTGVSMDRSAATQRHTQQAVMNCVIRHIFIRTIHFISVLCYCFFMGLDQNLIFSPCTSWASRILSLVHWLSLFASYLIGTHQWPPGTSEHSSDLVKVTQVQNASTVCFNGSFLLSDEHLQGLTGDMQPNESHHLIVSL